MAGCPLAESVESLSVSLCLCETKIENKMTLPKK